MLRRLFTLVLLLTLSVAHASAIKVATFHPLLSEIASQVGGDSVEVIALANINGDPHHFEPSPEELRKASDAKLYLISGMGLESYLTALKSILPPGSRLIDVGSSLPALHGACDHADHEHHEHADHQLDPHWWHSINRVSRATTVIAEALADADPAHADLFRQRATAYRQRLRELENWTRLQIAKIPRDRRRLATTHSAFNYFCSDFGLTPISVQGLNHEQESSANTLAGLIENLASQNVPALFPEKESNSKILDVLARDTGLRLGKPLISDANGSHSYEEMVRHNVNAIVEGLTGK